MISPTRWIFTVLAISLVLLYCNRPVVGLDVFLSVTGDNSNNGSESSPVKDFHIAVSLLQTSDDVINVLPGQYWVSQQVLFDGTSAPVAGINVRAVDYASTLLICNTSTTMFNITNGFLNITDLRILGLYPCVNIKATNATLTVRNALFAGHQAIDASNSLVDVNGTIVSGHDIPMRFENHLAGTKLTHTTFQSHLYDRALAVDASEHEFLVEDCVFMNNNIGVGLFLSKAPTVIRRTEFSSNTARTYVAAYLGYNSSVPTLIEDCSFIGNTAPTYPAVYTFGPLTVIRSMFWANVATNTDSSNGAITVTGNSNLTVLDSDFRANYAVWGATIYTAGHTLIRNSNFSDNHVYFGGVVCISTSIKVDLLVENCIFDANHGRHGSGIYAFSPPSSMRVVGTTFQSHNATGLGVIISFLDYLDIADSFFVNNTLKTACIYSEHDNYTVKVTNCYFARNTAAAAGMFLRNHADVIIDACSFYRNIIPLSSVGPVLLPTLGGSLIVNNTQFLRNEAYDGTAGVFIFAPDTSLFAGQYQLSIYDSEFWQNYGHSITRQLSGAAVFIAVPANVTIERTLFYNNYARSEAAIAIGGALVVDEMFSGAPWSYVQIDNCTFDRNIAFGKSFAAGGAIALQASGVANITNSIFKNNFLSISLLGAGSGSSQGGAIVAANSEDQRLYITISDCLFEKNSALYGSAVSIHRADEALFLRNKFFANSASFEAGAVAINMGQLGYGPGTTLIKQCIVYFFENEFDSNDYALDWEKFMNIISLNYGAADIYAFGTQAERVNIVMEGNKFGYCSYKGGVEDRDTACIMIDHGNITWIPHSAELRNGSTVAVLPAIKVWETSICDFSLYGPDILLQTAGIIIQTADVLVESDVDVIRFQLSGGNFRCINSQSNCTVRASGLSSFLGSAYLHNVDFNIEAGSYGINVGNPLFLNSSRLLNFGTLDHQTPLNTSAVRAAPGTGSAYINYGSYSVYATEYDALEFQQHESATITYQITNFHKPETSYLRGTQISPSVVSGTFVLDSTGVRPFVEPAFGQVFTFMHSDQVTVPWNFTSYRDVGGYLYNTSFTSKQMDVIISHFTPLSINYTLGLNGFVIQFPRNTHEEGDGTCSDILEYSSLSLLSLDDASCTWIAPNRLVVRSSQLPQLGSVIRITDDFITDSEMATFTARNSGSPTRIELPKYIADPVAIESVQDTSSECQDLELDASVSRGLGIFGAAYNWALNNSVPALLASEIEALNSYLIQHKYESKILVPNYLVPAGAAYRLYQFDLFVVSNLTSTRVSSAISVSVNRTAVWVPSIELDGPESRFVYVSLPLRLSGYAVVPCNFASTAFTYTWVQTGGPQLNYTTVGPTLMAAPRSMQPGFNYTFQFKAQAQSDPARTAVQSVTVYAQGSPMTLFTQKSGLLIANNPSNISVRLYDPDELPGSQPNTTYYWDIVYCPSYLKDASPVMATQNTVNDFVDAVNAGQPPNVLVHGFSERTHCFLRGIEFPVDLQLDITAQTRFSANILEYGYFLMAVYAYRDTRAAIALATFTTEPSVPMPIPVEIQPALLRPKALAHEKLTLRGLISQQAAIPANHSIFWTVEYGDKSVFIPENVLTSTTNLNLVIKPNTLKPGKPYAFQLNVRNSSDVVAGWNRVWIVVNSVPSGGRIRISPTTSLYQGRPLTVSSLGFVDEDLPLRFVFSVVRDSTGEEVVLTSSTRESPKLSLAAFPVAGDASNGYQLTLKVRILDSFWAETVVTRQLTVLPPTTPFDPAALQALLSAAISEDDFSLAENYALLLLNTPMNASATLSSLRLIVSQVLLPVAQNQTLWSLEQIHFFGQTIRQVAAATTGIQIDSALALDILSLYSLISNGAQSVPSSVSTNVPLAAWSNDISRSTLNAITNAMTVFMQSSFDTFSDPAVAARVLDTLKELLALQARASVPDEQASQAGDDWLGIFSKKAGIADLLGSSANLTSGNTSIVLSGNAANTSAVVSVEVVRWRGSNFPFISTDSSQGKPISVVSIFVTDQGDAGSVGFDGTVTATFHPFGAPENGAFVCGLFDEATRTWKSNLCQTTVLADGAVDCTCPTNVAPHLGLLFKIDMNTQTPSTITPGEISPSEGNASSGSMSAAAAAAAVVIIVIVSAAVIAGVVWYKKRSAMQTAKAEMRDKLSRASAEHEHARTNTTATPAPSALQWKRAARPDQGDEGL